MILKCAKRSPSKAMTFTPENTLILYVLRYLLEKTISSVRMIEKH